MIEKTEVTCPSGLVGQVRGLRTKEVNLLTDPKSLKNGKVIDDLICTCWLETDDPGPYSLDSLGKLDWGKVLAGDRYYVLLKIREATYGEEYSFKYQCSDAACRHKYVWELSFDALPVKTLSDESMETFKNGNSFEVDINGTKVVYRLQTGDGEQKAAKLMNRYPNSKLAPALASRIVSIEGVDPGKVVEFIDDLPLGVLRKLLKAFDATDCGVNTTIEVECPKCGNVEEIELPLGKEFWLPS